MEPRPLARLLAGGRLLIGAVLLAAPTAAGRRWIGDDAERPGTAVVLRGLGARDLAIGLGVLAALDTDAPVQRWLEAGAIADLADGTAMALVGDGLPRSTRLATAGTAVGAAALGIWLSRRLEG